MGAGHEGRASGANIGFGLLLSKPGEAFWRFQAEASRAGVIELNLIIVEYEIKRLGYPGLFISLSTALSIGLSTGNKGRAA